MDRRDTFLDEVLGPVGAGALRKALQKSPALARILVPRVILSWAVGACRGEYQGPVPGLEQSFAEFSKAEQGWTGAISAGEESWPLVRVSAYRVAACLAAALGVDSVAPDRTIRDLDITRLGKSIDSLAWSRMLAKSRAEPRVESTHGDLEVVSSPGNILVRKRGGGTVLDRFWSLADARKFAEGRAGASSDGIAGPDDEGLGKGDVVSIKKLPILTSVGGRVVRSCPGPTGHGHGLSQPGFVRIPAGDCKLCQGTGIHPDDQAHARFVQPLKWSPEQLVTDSRESSRIHTHPKPHLVKIDLPGTTAKPRRQEEPQAPEQPRMQPSQRLPGPKVDAQGPGVKAPPRTPDKPPKVPGLPKLKVGKSEAFIPCSVCGERQFQGGGFSGCACFSALAGDVLVKAAPGGYELSFGLSWDADARGALLRAIYPAQS